MKCPKCGSEKYIKNGIIKQKQRYCCKNCMFRYTVNEKSPRVSSELKRLTIQLYLEGLGYRSIERILKISRTSVMNWVKQYARQLETLKSPTSPTIVEIDEMHTYIASKKNTSGFGLLLIDFPKESSKSLLAAEGLKLVKKSGI